MDKTRSGDLDAEIGNFRGFTAQRQEHIHNYVYKPKGLLAKGPGWMESRKSDSFRGFLQKVLDTRKYLKITRDHRDVNAKLLELHLLPLAGGQRGTSRRNHRRSGWLWARVTCGEGRGRRAGRVRLLTSGENGRGWLESNGNGKSRRPPRSSMHDGVPVVLQQ
jgi:hypothetical protein